MKRQLLFDLTTRFGVNRETILVCDGEDVVYLTGNNGRMEPINPGEVVSFENNVVSVTGGRIDPIVGINEFTYKICDRPDPAPVGPGQLFLSDGMAFFITFECQAELSLILQAIATAPAFRVTFEIETIIDAGNALFQLNVNEDEFMLVISDATTLRLSARDRIVYSGTTLSVNEIVIEDSIEDFFVVNLANNMVQTGSFNATSPLQNFRGPGQLFVGAISAIFIEDISFRTGSSDLVEVINSEVAGATFTFGGVIDNMIMVQDPQMAPIFILSPGTKIVGLPRAARVRYSGIGMDGLLSFEGPGGRIINLRGVGQFSLFDNNRLETFTPSMPPEDLDHRLSRGGTLFIDTTENTALFTTETNPAIAALLRMNLRTAIASTIQSVSYSTTTDSEGVRLLLRTVGNVTQTLQTITGSYVMSVQPLQTVTFRNNEVVIEDFFGNPATRIGEVDLLVTDTGSGTSGVFNMSTIVPFSGPGTLIYSRGVAFYTTDQSLGSRLSFLSATAPIPRIIFELNITGSNVIDGVNHTVGEVILTIGGDRVITFEATSYSTSTDQEILYSGGLVTVTRPIRTGGGIVSYDGSTQTVRYIDVNGTTQTIMGVITFHDFSGGDVRTTVSPDDRIVVGAGKLYISEDGTEVLFSSSNIITPNASALIRRAFTIFMASADQFSSIYTRVYNLSTNSATVTYPGGGIIWYNELGEALYLDDDGVSSAIARAVGSLLVLSKSTPAKRTGIVRTIFNGRSIYDYAPVLGNREILIGSGGMFVFNGTALIGDGFVRTEINSVITFDGVEVKKFNSSDAPVKFFGHGLLLIQNDSDTAFFTTFSPAINFLLQSIANVREYLLPPQIQPGTGTFTTKNRTATVKFGTDVTVYDGTTVTFECDVMGGRPEPNVTFFKLPSMMLNDSSMGVSIENNSLTLINVSRMDAGTYLCRGSNGVPPDVQAMSSLTVREASKFM